MKKKALAMTILAVLLLTMCATMFCACEDEKPRDVKLELVNPITGEEIIDGDTIDLPTVKTYIEVRIKDIETGEYLTDDDLPENTVRGSYHARFVILSDDSTETITLSTSGYWPTLEKINETPYYSYYEVMMYFDCRPKHLGYNSNFKRKYINSATGVRFYINK